MLYTATGEHRGPSGGPYDGGCSLPDPRTPSGDPPRALQAQRPSQDGPVAQSGRYCRRAEKRAGGRIARTKRGGDTWLAVVASAEGGPWRRSLAWAVVWMHKHRQES
ncbi:hypothetical protein yc1106_00945 [Curvularia clavata]|uniref:Uncharacterized protein n=1 Tax=Curvularia clavata TaxID=95742 RepID=A0A9Q9DPU1_CURCL|nr:hypothetical protein yc1106_00945 [Curvularia clavata]